MRDKTNKEQFLNRNDLIGTFLHELTHNLIAPHNKEFYKILEEFKNETLDLMYKKKSSFEGTGISYFIHNNFIGHILGSSMNNNNVFFMLNID